MYGNPIRRMRRRFSTRLLRILISCGVIMPIVGISVVATGASPVVAADHQGQPCNQTQAITNLSSYGACGISQSQKSVYIFDTQSQESDLLGSMENVAVALKRLSGFPISPGPERSTRPSAGQVLSNPMTRCASSKLAEWCSGCGRR